MSEQVGRPSLIRKRDLWWLLALPLYIVLGTIRHELSHSLAGLAQGASIAEFAFLPDVSLTEGRLLWGHVSFAGPYDWRWTAAAPYICDLITFVLTFVLLQTVRIRRRGVWLNLVVLGLLSPLVNSLYNYRVFVLRWQGDLALLASIVGARAVHAYVVVTACAYVAGVLVALRTRRQREFGGTDAGLPIGRPVALSALAAAPIAAAIVAPVWCRRGHIRLSLVNIGAREIDLVEVRYAEVYINHASLPADVETAGVIRPDRETAIEVITLTPDGRWLAGTVDVRIGPESRGHLTIGTDGRTQVKWWGEIRPHYFGSASQEVSGSVPLSPLPTASPNG